MATGRGDVANSDWCSGGCGPDGVVDIDDIYAVLDAFQGSAPSDCVIRNYDIAGMGGVCVRDGIIDISDIFAVFDAYQDIDICCSGESAQSGGGTESESSIELTMVPSQTLAETQDSISIDVYASGITDLRGYQLSIQSLGGEAGTMILDSMNVDVTRNDYIFTALKPHVVLDASTGRLAVALESDGVGAGGPKYLATFTFHPSTEAFGDFTMSLDAGQSSLALDALGQPITISTAPAILRVR